MWPDLSAQASSHAIFGGCSLQRAAQAGLSGIELKNTMSIATPPGACCRRVMCEHPMGLTDSRLFLLLLHCCLAAGIPEGATFVHVMYVYRDPSDNVPYDDSIEVNFKLPVREED